MARRRDREIPAQAPSGGALGSLLSGLGLRASEPEPEPEPVEAPAPPEGPLLASVARVIVRRERKGHGGHVATRIQGLPVDTLEVVAAAMRKALGVGSRVVDEDVIVQGDVGDRVEAWLQGEGARRVTRG